LRDKQWAYIFGVFWEYIMVIPLVNKEDVIIPGNRDKTIERPKEKENTGANVVRKKQERPVRILRIRYYEKISLPFMQDGKLENRDAFAVNRSLEDLLKAFGYNTKIQGTTTSHDCIIVEKGNRMGVGNKFIFVEIGTNDFYTLKKQMENHTTICAFNQGEFVILDGKRSSLTETFDIPKIWKETKDINRRGLDTDKVVAIEILRSELKDRFKAYHSYDDKRIDKMKEPELLELKRLINRKIEIENRNRKFYRDLLK